MILWKVMPVKDNKNIHCRLRLSFTAPILFISSVKHALPFVRNN